MTGQNIRYSGVNCTLGPSKSIRSSGDFSIAGLGIARFVSTYFTVILLGFQFYVVRCNRAFVIARFVIAGCHFNKFWHALQMIITASVGIPASSRERNSSSQSFVSCPH